MNCSFIAFIAVFLLSGTASLSCYTGDENGTNIRRGYGYCMSSFYINEKSAAFSGRHGHQKKAGKHEDKLECTIEVDSDSNYTFNCPCFHHKCNKPMSYEEFGQSEFEVISGPAPSP
ncbi:unnamed protein product [Caenorhabditis sp. 36 PRJEB53466]|nr:unnamed protein product [Caenorhabditis sp. 36 PRJEB53466]